MGSLIDRARAAGLSVTADGDRLIIRGPRRAAEVVRELQARKDEVMALLASVVPPLPASDEAVEAGLVWVEWRIAALMRERSLSRPEAARLACRELVAHLDGRTAMAEPAPPAVSWTELAARRWGPSLDHDLPSIVVPHGWRSAAAALPPADWLRWRARSDALQAALGHEPSADEIHVAEYVAYTEMREDPPR